MKHPKCQKCGYKIWLPLDVITITKENNITKGEFEHRGRCGVYRKRVALPEVDMVK